MAKLRFYLDEGVHVGVAQGLNRRGVVTLSAKDADNLGLSDEEQLNYAIENNLVIVTHDTDFLSMAIDIEHKGIVYVHQQKYSIGELIRNLKSLWDIAEQKDMKNRIEFL